MRMQWGGGAGGGEPPRGRLAPGADRPGRGEVGQARRLDQRLEGYGLDAHLLPRAHHRVDRQDEHDDGRLDPALLLALEPRQPVRQGRHA